MKLTAHIFSNNWCEKFTNLLCKPTLEEFPTISGFFSQLTIELQRWQGRLPRANHPSCTSCQKKFYFPLIYIYFYVVLPTTHQHVFPSLFWVWLFWHSFQIPYRPTLFRISNRELALDFHLTEAKHFLRISKYAILFNCKSRS